MAAHREAGWHSRQVPLGRGLLAAIGVLIAALLALLAGPAPARAAPFVYVTNLGSNDVSQYGVGAGGLLAPLSPPTAAAGARPLEVAVSPDGRSVYVTNASSDSVSQYDVGARGALSPKTPATVATGDLNPVGVAVSPDGRSVYVANFGDFNGLGVVGSVSQYDVGAGGALSPKRPARVAAGYGAQGVAVSPDGRSVYVADYEGTNQGHSVSQYDVGAGGALSPKRPATVAGGSGADAVAVSPDGRSVYVTNDDSNSVSLIQDVSQYDVGAGGALSPKRPATVAAGAVAAAVAVSPDGHSVYVPNLGGRVSQYDVGAGGALSPKSPATVAAGPSFGPAGVAVNPDGQSVYVTNRGSNNVFQYDVGATGALLPKSPAAVTAGDGPEGVAVSPAGVPTTKQQCKNGGWKRFGFKNQGQCLRFVRRQARQACRGERQTIGREAFGEKYGKGRHHRHALCNCVKRAIGAR